MSGLFVYEYKTVSFVVSHSPVPDNRSIRCFPTKAAKIVIRGVKMSASILIIV